MAAQPSRSCATSFPSDAERATSPVGATVAVATASEADAALQRLSIPEKHRLHDSQVDQLHDSPAGTPWAAVSFEGALCAVATPHHEVRAHLERYLGSGWTVSGSRRNNSRSVRGTVDAEHKDALRAAVAAFDEVPFFDRTTARFATIPGGAQVVVGASGPALVRPGAPAIVDIVAAEQAELVQWTPRLVREVITSELEADGWRLLHAAAVSVNGRGALIVGRKGSGKTASALALAASGAALLSNDRVLVCERDGDVLAGSWPTTCNVDESLAEALGWQTTLADVQTSAGVHPKEAASRTRGKWRIPPALLIDPFGLTLGRLAPLRTILIPHFDASRRHTHLSTGGDARLNEEVLLDVADRNALFPDVLGLYSDRSQIVTRSLLSSLQRLRIVEVQLGTDVAEAGERLLQAL